MTTEQVKLKPCQLFDQKPSLGAATPEPSLREIVLAYYRPHFSEHEAEDLTDRYCAALSPAPDADTVMVPTPEALEQALAETDPEYDPEWNYGPQAMAMHDLLAASQSLFTDEEVRRLRTALAKSHCYTGSTSPIQVILGFRTIEDRNAFLDAHIAALQSKDTPSHGE